MSKLVRDHVRSNVVGYLALFLVLTMGTAYATHPGGANTISTQDIINGQVRAADIGSNQVLSADVRDDTIANGGLSAADLAPGSVASSELTTNAVPGDGIGSEGSSKLANDSVGANEIETDAVRASEILDGSIGSADLSTSALGARAWGLVSDNGALLRSKNVDAVSKPSLGTYCIDPVDTIDATTSVVLLTPNANSNGTGTGNSSVVEFDAQVGAGGCPATTFTVSTYLHDGDQIDDDDGGGNTTGDTTPLNDEGFAFMVP